MQRILLFLAGLAFLALPAAAAARQQHQPARPGFLVVRDASTDRGVVGKPVVTIVVRGFVIGRIAQEGKVDLYPFGTGSLAAQASGIDVSRRTVYYRNVQGTEFSGSSFRFRAVGGAWRVVVYGAGISLYAGGEGPRITLHGSAAYPRTDGVYSLDGGPFVSLPSGVLTTRFQAK